MKILRDTHCTCSIKDISLKTSIKIDDIVSTLDVMGLLKIWKGQYVASISEEVGFCNSSQQQIVENYFKNNKIPMTLCKPEKLNWTPHPPPSN